MNLILVICSDLGGFSEFLTIVLAMHHLDRHQVSLTNMEAWRQCVVEENSKGHDVTVLSASSAAS